MKKLLLISLFSGLSINSFALTNTSLSTNSYYCNKIQLLESTININQIQQNCKQVIVSKNTKIISSQDITDLRGSDQIKSPEKKIITTTAKFYTDNKTYLECSFKNNQLTNCKTK